jgi:ABC-type uncharacterized transport system permease subunit
MTDQSWVQDIKEARKISTGKARVHTWVMIGIVFSVLLAALSGVAAALIAGLPDWYMHLGMWIVTIAWVLLYLNAFYARRLFRRLLNLGLYLGVSLYWVYVLLALIPSQPIIIGGELVTRGTMELLYLPIALLGLEALLMIIHVAVIGRWRWISE